MRVLFVSNDLLGGNIANLLVQEGHDVKLYIHEKGRRGNFQHMVKKTQRWDSELAWVGKKGLIIFDDIGFGKTQDELRRKGYTVFGGSEAGDKLEQNRVWGQETFAKAGMKTLPVWDFVSIQDAIVFVKKHPGCWVVKQNGTASKSVNYVGHFKDGRDVVEILEAYRHNNTHESQPITLQERVDGVEVAITRFFNGTDWVGPMLINAEHKKFFPGNLGPTTSEMGTLGWYESDEANGLFQATLAKLKPHLVEIDYRGIIDINCIANKKSVFPLEATSRFGSPMCHLQSELNRSPWGELLLALAKGEPYPLRYKTGYGVVLVVAIPPFPYAKQMAQHSQIGTHIYFEDSLTKEDMRHIHFEEISWDKRNKQYYISDDRGYILYVTGEGQTIEAAQNKAHQLIKKIYIPKMFYRADIGSYFAQEGIALLKKWGYLSSSVQHKKVSTQRRLVKA